LNPRTAFTVGGFQDRCHQPLGHLTAADREDLLAFAKDDRKDLQQAEDPELEAIMESLDNRQAKEALDLTDKHDRESGPPPDLAERHMQERQGRIRNSRKRGIVISVLNAASYVATAIAPGEIVALFGYGMGPATGVVASGPVWPTQLGGVSIWIGGFPAPLQYAQAGQINAQVRREIAGQISTGSAICIAGTSSQLFSFRIAAATMPSPSCESQFESMLGSHLFWYGKSPPVSARKIGFRGQIRGSR
jgi:hypothetical protein